MSASRFWSMKSLRIAEKRAIDRLRADLPGDRMAAERALRMARTRIENAKAEVPA